MSDYAEVRLLDTPYCIDKPFDYYIPPNLRRDILCGDFVTVPFGTGGRKRIGVVTRIKDTPEKSDINHKPISELCSPALSLDDEMMKLCEFIKEQTLCTYGDAVRAAVPASALSRLKEVYRYNSGASVNQNDQALSALAEYIASKGEVSLDTVRAKFENADALLKKLVSGGTVIRDFRVHEAAEKKIDVYSLAVPAESIGELRLRSEKQREIISFLADAPAPVSGKELCEILSVSTAQIKSLTEKGLLNVESRKIDRSMGLTSFDYAPTEITLNEEQNAAYLKLCELCDSQESSGVLLHGVTGSGKTSVMLKTVDHVLASGKGVIVLLPEIALTPQSLRIFCSRYGKRVAIIHSALSAGERFDTYRRIKSGEADMVIGTRSAVFSPVKSLGLIIIDEEQEHTYKSDMNPKYHTRDIARFRAAYNGGVMLLASATPSFESYKKALDGRYTLIELTKRYGSAKLPRAIIADMRKETAQGNTSPLGALLRERLYENTKNNNQSILFINRRGYNNFISCRDCGEAIKCPRCSVSMTYHTRGRDYSSGYLACHWCGQRLPLPSVCPSCGGAHLARMGYGTQRVEEELSILLPNTNVLRMDTDTTTDKSAYEELLGKFRSRKADILLGTQMVTKGHDFPDVTLVGVLLADASLYLDDFRAAERTFAMLTQVIGRAGRADKEGVAVIQTNNPDNECIRLACAQDYKTFYESEIKLRRLLVFPPFCDIALLTITSCDERELAQAAAILSGKLSELTRSQYADVPLIIFGPFEAPVYKVENRYRMRMVLKCRANKRCRALLSELLVYFGSSGANGLSLSVDINPTNL